jgi:hypothetical protein
VISASVLIGEYPRYDWENRIYERDVFTSPLSVGNVNGLDPGLAKNAQPSRQTTTGNLKMKNLFCLRAPPINPLNGKAQKLPIINPFDRHGRVFFFAWASFCE